MRLRSLTKHIKDQNWFAVALDFVIVVFGVFIGLQVQQWAVERNRAASEVVYLERLHDEVLHAEEIRSPLVDERKNNLRLLGSAHLVLSNRIERQSLSGDECEAITEAWIYSNVTADLPTTAELLSAGNLDSINSADIRSVIISLDQKARRAKDVVQGMSVNAVTLYQEHPDLITLDLVSHEVVFGESDIKESCDTAGMRADPLFRNNFIDNVWRYENYYAVAVESVSDELKTLHSALDRELGINHLEIGDTP